MSELYTIPYEIRFTEKPEGGFKATSFLDQDVSGEGDTLEEAEESFLQARETRNAKLKLDNPIPIGAIIKTFPVRIIASIFVTEDTNERLKTDENLKQYFKNFSESRSLKKDE